MNRFFQRIYTKQDAKQCKYMPCNRNFSVLFVSGQSFSKNRLLQRIICEAYKPLLLVLTQSKFVIYFWYKKISGWETSSIFWNVCEPKQIYEGSETVHVQKLNWCYSQSHRTNFVSGTWLKIDCTTLQTLTRTNIKHIWKRKIKETQPASKCT